MSDVVILGIFVADLAFRADRLPRIGETIEGAGFKMGPGGKGSNQAVAAARAGAAVTIITRLGRDAFGRTALDTWRHEGIAAATAESDTDPTGAAFIYVDHRSGDNAIIVVPGAAGGISAADVEASADLIASARIFMTPARAANRCRPPRPRDRTGGHGVTTILNPAPAQALDDAIYPFCDYLTPNETEAAQLTGLPVASLDEARRAGDALLRKGAGTALITLGAAGVLLHSAHGSVHIPAFDAGPVVETAGAGDAFNGGFAAELARGASPEAAARFGCAVAGISVTRPGTAPSMPALAEVRALLGA